MSTGFGASKGISINDRITGPTEALPDRFSFHIWTYRTGEGSGTGGRIFERQSHVYTLLNNNNQVANTYAFGDLSGGSRPAWEWTRPAANTWASIGLSVDTTSAANDPTVWQNGSKLTVGSGLTQRRADATYITSANTWTLGNISTGSRAWDGMLAEMAWWSVILTDAEFRMLQQGVSPELIRPESLMHRFALDGAAAGFDSVTRQRYATVGTKAYLPAPPYLRHKAQIHRLSWETSGGAAPSELIANSAIAVGSVSDAILTPAAVSLTVAAAGSTGAASMPTLTAGAVNIDSQAAIATAGVSDAVLSTDGSILTPQAAISTAVVGNPSLTAGAVTLEPSAAVSSAFVTDPSLTNGAQLAPIAPSASAAVSTPTLSAGGTSVQVVSAGASATVGSAGFTAGGVQLATAAASASSLVTDPEITSGKQIDSSPAIATAGVSSASFIAGLVNLAAASAGTSAAVPSVSLSPGAASILPVSAFATAASDDPFLLDGGMQWHTEMVYRITAEDRSYTISAEDRSYSVPVV